MLLAVFSCTMDLGITATKHDANIYHFGGFLAFLFPAIGFLIEANIFSIKENVMKTKRDHILLWITLFLLSTISFAVCNGLTSEEFQIAMQNKNQTKIASDTTIDDIETTEDSAEEKQSQNTKENVANKTVEQESADDTNNEPDLLETTIEDERTDINGHIFTFNDATYVVNGIEVTFHSVEFEKTDKSLNGYQIVFAYSAKNTNSSKSTLKFASSEGQFRCDNGKTLLSLSALNAGSNKYDSSPVLEANETTDTFVMFHAISNGFAKRINGVDYEAMEIGDIYSDEHIELDVMLTGWINETSESMIITFELN